jgi:TonB-dependent receptor
MSKTTNDKPAVSARAKQLGLLLGGLLISCILPANAGDLLGRVSDSTGVHSLGGAQIEITGTNYRAVSDASGEYRIGGLPAGNYTVVIRYIGATQFSQSVTIGTSDSVRLDAQLSTTAGVDEVVLVVGQRAAQSSALSRQRSADSISSFLTRDGIGQFPDQNVTESVRRLPGVSVQNDQGEGRFIVLRGLSPNLNSASLNGVRLTAPESDIRQVALDVIPSELIESIEVQKSLIPEMDGDAIGGSVDIRTTSALDRRGPFLSLTGQASYNDLMDSWSPKVGIDASTIVGDRFGISGGFSYFDRQLGSDNLESDDWTEEDGVIYAESMQLRDYDITRTRIGATLGLDFRVSDATTLYARGVYNSFEDMEYRSILELDFGDAVPVSGSASDATFDLGSDEEISVVRDIKDRNEKQTIYSFVAGGTTYSDLWTFDYSASFTHAEEDESDSFDPTAFERTFEEGELRLTQTGLNTNLLGLNIDSGSIALFTDASEYEFDEVERVIQSLGEDEEIATRLDIARDFNLANAQAQIKFGGRARWREKSYASSMELYDGYDGAGDFLLSDVTGSVDYALSNINPVPSAAAVRTFLGDLSDFEINAVESVFENAAPSFIVNEDIYASYLQGRMVSGPWTVIGGGRVEHTKNEIQANRVDLVEEDGTFNGTTVAQDTVFITPVAFTKNYTNLLPSVNLRYEASEDIILRAAAYRSVMRPNMEDLAPRFVIEQDDGDEREGEFGNPDLDPYRAWSFDAGIEWYFSDNAILQGGVFYKSVEDFIARIVFEDVTYNGIFVNEGVIPFNGDSADVMGIELNYQHSLSMLPAPFDGLLVGANYTYVDSKATINGREIALPGTSENVLNLMIGYEKGPFSLRLAGVYRDEYLDELSDDGDADRYIKDHFSLDASAKYRITDKVQVFVEAINLTNEPFVAVARTTDFGDRPLQFEEYSWTFNAGIRITY